MVELELILTELQPLILGNFMHCRVCSLCNQFLSQFSMDHFETIHACCGYIDDVQVKLCRQKKFFLDKTTAFLT